MTSETIDDAADADVRRTELTRLQAELRALDAKGRLRVMEGLYDDIVLESDHGVRYSCRSVGEFRRIRKGNAWDAPIVAWLETFTPDDVFFDIGANIGGVSLVAGRLHAGRVPIVAFEPAADTFAALSRNILLNDLGAVITPLQVGLFDSTGLRPFHYHALGAGTSLHALGDAIDYRQKRFTPVAVQPVMAYALDDLIAHMGLPRPTRIKLDVDGTESRVIAGSTRTLTAGPCEIWIEVVEVGDHLTLHTQMEVLGFTFVRRVDHDEPRPGRPRVYDAFFRR